MTSALEKAVAARGARIAFCALLAILAGCARDAAGPAGQESDRSIASESRGAGSEAAQEGDAPVVLELTCGKETFTASFAPQRATVTQPGGRVLQLARLDPDAGPGAPLIYTDGRISIALQIKGANISRVMFARGRMAPEPCAAIQK